MSLTRVALIYDNVARPDTTGHYCRRALEGLVSVTHFLPSEPDQIPRTGFDLYLEIDDGLMHRLPTELRPCAWWAIDTHINFDWCLRKSRDFDFVFTAQRDGAEGLRKEGIASAVWLPLGCDPEIHRRHEVPKTLDICFVGTVFSGQREDLLRLLQQHFPRMFIGRAYFEDMARTYSSSRLVFNRSIRNDLNMRVFEALACGSLLLTNDLSANGQSRLFRDGQHLAAYTNPEEMLDKVRFYLKREQVREAIAAAGREEVLARHTYRHRMEAILRAVAAIPRSVPAAQYPPASPAAEIKQGALTGAPVSGRSEADPRCSSYFDHVRPEILALIPQTARQVLDIGCGAGRLGEALKARQTAEVYGIEYDEQAAQAARRRLDRVIVGDVESSFVTFAPHSLDAIVCGDVLEHLREPARVLSRARDWLRPDGVLIASIPNVRHHSIVSSLLGGNWTYETAGLLDRTHLRFFTRSSIEDLFHLAGFRIQRWGGVPGPGHEEWKQRGRPGEVHMGRLQVNGLSSEVAEEFYIYQFLVVAEPVQPTKSPAEVPPPTVQTRRIRGPELATAGRDHGTMRFTQDFIRDFEQFDFFGPPFAFVRFGDGERAICTGQPIVTQDAWSYQGGPSRFAEDLNASLRFAAPDFYYGISDGCCDLAGRDWYLQQLPVPMEQVTFATIFVNWNYRRFRQVDLRNTVIVASHGGDFTVPEDMLTQPFDIDALVSQLLSVDRPILVSAGPAAEIIIHKYWQRARHKQTIVDVGSAIDEWIKGKRTRRYQQAGTRTAELVCRW
jgi:2-polyprenyl-3-methyl-5-hydroxy-6-metoxy-1,4-benzoquinol methylase